MTHLLMKAQQHHRYWSTHREEGRHHLFAASWALGEAVAKLENSGWPDFANHIREVALSLERYTTSEVQAKVGSWLSRMELLGVGR